MIEKSFTKVLSIENKNMPNMDIASKNVFFFMPNIKVDNFQRHEHQIHCLVGLIFSRILSINGKE